MAILLTVKAVVSILLLLLALLIVAMNWWCLVVSVLNGRGVVDMNPSPIYLVSLIIASMAFGFCPYGGRMWIWIIPAADFTNWMLPVLLLCLVYWKFSKRAPNDPTEDDDE